MTWSFALLVEVNFGYGKALFLSFLLIFICLYVYLFYLLFVAFVRPGQARYHSDLFYYAGNCNTSSDVIKENFITRMNNDTILQNACLNVPTCVVGNVKVNSSSHLTNYWKIEAVKRVVTRLIKETVFTGGYTCDFAFVSMHIRNVFACDLHSEGVQYA